MGSDYRKKMPRELGTSPEQQTVIVHQNAAGKICAENPTPCKVGTFTGVVSGMVQQSLSDVLAGVTSGKPQPVHSDPDYTQPPQDSLRGVLTESYKSGVNVGAGVIYSPPLLPKNKGQTPN